MSRVLADWLAGLPDAAQQRALDAWAIDQLGIAGLALMERAGTGLAERCEQLAPQGEVAVVCGTGNNGGDGLVAARLLRAWGRDVRVLVLGDPGALKGDARTNLERLPGAAPEPFRAERLHGCSLIIDAILGTGFEGTPREPAAGAIAAINAASATEPKGPVIVACDVPSGVDASTGEALGEAVRATATVTFHAAKPGLWIAPGKTLVGELTVIDIGIPTRGAPVQASVGVIGDGVLSGLPHRSAGATKFTSGSILVCGGSHGLTGAPALASLAAARAGAGYVTVAVPVSIMQVMQTKLLEVMSLGLPEVDGGFATSAAEQARERSERVDSLVIGPGLGRSAQAQEFARELAASAPVPIVLDADGLGAHAQPGALERLAARTAGTVLTPHAGELGRLVGVPSAEIDAHRLVHARETAARAGAVVVLKGDDTIIAEPDGRVAVSPGGAPMLATAGTGDVLSGVVAALLARRVAPFTAACAAVLAHVRAGQLAAQTVGSADGVIASDVIEALPRALAGAR